MRAVKRASMQAAALLMGCALVAALGLLLQGARGPAGYATLHEEAPMLVLGGADTEAVRRAARALAESQEAAVLPFTDDPSGSLHAGFYPTALLIAYADAEDARRALLSKRDSPSAAAYHKRLGALIEEYERQIERYEKGLGVGTRTTITSFGGTMHPDHLAALLTEGEDALARMKREEDRRFACASGDASACLRAHLWEPSRERARTDAPPQPAAPFKPEEIRDPMRAYTEALGIPLDDVLTIELARSSCYPSYAPVRYDVSTHPSDVSTGVVTPRFTLVSDAFFYEVERIPVRFSQLFHSAGATYSLQAFNTYICQDFATEAMRLLAIRKAARELSAEPFMPHERSFALTGLMDAQERFLSEDVKTERAYLALIAEAERLERVHGPRLLTKMLGERGAARLSALIDAKRGRSADFELLIGYFDNLLLSTYTTARLDPYRTSVFYMLRGGISSFLALGGSTGPFAEGTTFFKEKADTELTPNGFVMRSFRRDLSSEHSLEELLAKNLVGYRAVFAPHARELTARMRR
jgi:hypothetical protein